MNPIIERIKKLLSLATSPNENEAKLAASKASELLVKHNLSLQEVKNTNFEYTLIDLETGMVRFKNHQLYILTLLARHYFVEVNTSVMGRIKGSRYRAKGLQIFGRPENVEVASYVFGYLNQVYPSLWKDYRKRIGCERGAEKSYYAGLTEGISEVLKVTRLHVEQETGLVVIKDAELQKEHRARCNGTQKIKGDKSDEAYSHGMNDGKNVRISKPIESRSSNQGLRLEAK